jgi:GDP-4-dehydro-6-deoxy-D-mannose reductase
MKKALITGFNGFVGSHLNNYLIEKGYEVFGTVIPTSDKDLSPNLRAVDILDFEGIRKTFEEISPDYIFHLAAFTSPSESFKDPSATLDNNMRGQMNILEAIKELKLMNTKTLVVSSSEVYGSVSPQDLPIDEKTELRPLSPYAVSKIGQDFLGLQYFLSQQVQVVRVRPFNHIGPGQAPIFVVPSFAKQIAEIEKGKQEPILKVGNLESKRDFTDVRDVVKAYELLMNRGAVGEVYNIGSGKSHKISEILDILLSFSTEKIIIEKDPERMRPSDIPDVVCDFSKIEKAVGWKAEIPLETSLKDTLDYFRNIV